jgi:hypothetical protein
MPNFLLPPITDFEAYNKNTKEQYEALGRFIAAFEMMVYEARECSIHLLTTAASQGRLTHVAFHHPVMTAKPLFEIFRALVVESLNLPQQIILPKDKDIFLGVLKTIATEYFALSNMRNSLLHGTWFIGYSTEQDPNSDYFLLSRLKPTGAGLETDDDVPRHAHELLALKDRCEDTRTWISNVEFCVPRLNGFSDKVSDRFSFKDGKWQIRIAGGPPETLPRKSL